MANTSTPVVDDSTASSDEIRRPLLCLIMTPTRELALQIRNHLQQAAKHTALEVHVHCTGLKIISAKRFRIVQAVNKGSHCNP